MSATKTAVDTGRILEAGEPMKAVVFHGRGRRAWEAKPRPILKGAGDAIVRITTATICGTDLHILKGDVPSVDKGRVLGHEGVGVVEEVGRQVTRVKPGDKVLISCITSCGTCDMCRKGMYSHCRDGGWILGNTIDGTQAEYVRIPHADTSLYRLAPGADEEAMVMLSDILPTAFECGVQNGRVGPGDAVAIVGSGPIGLAAVITAQFYAPASVIVIDRDRARLDVARKLGATHTIDNSEGDTVALVMELTRGAGVDVAIEAVGVPETFDVCQSILAPGGRLANVGVHGKPVSLRLEKLWSHNVTVTTRLVDTAATPVLLRMVEAGRLDPARLVTHRFGIDEAMAAYDTFSNAGAEKALKVVLKNG
jgi:alcohol dehydrogenase